MEKIVGLKEFRENVAAFTEKVRKGESFVVVKRSRPIFKISPLEEDENRWETVIDFTKIRKGGIPAATLLKYLRNGQNRQKPKKA